METIKKFLSKLYVKIIINFALPIIIGELFSAIIEGIKDNETNWQFWIICGSFFVFLLIYIICMRIYYQADKKLEVRIHDIETQNEKFKKENSIFQKITISLTSLFSITSKEINKIANELNQNPKLDTWNFKVASSGICNSIYEALCALTGTDDFSVNVVVYDLKAKARSRNIKMIAEKSKFETPSDSFDKIMYMSTNKDFYAVKLFNKNQTSPAILTTSEEIKEKFVFSDDKKDHPKYTQYVGIPIHCDSNKMISLLQICSYNDSCIGENKSEISDIINNYILPFTYFALMNSKIEKSLINSIKLLNKED